MNKLTLCSIIAIMFAICFVFSIDKPSDKLLIEMDLNNKSVQDLWLLENSYYAKHGRPFKTFELHNYFMTQQWYKLSRRYNDSLLSKNDLQNIQLIDSKIKALRTNDFASNNNTKQLNLNNIYNKFQYPDFTDDEKQTMSNYGFVVMPTEQMQLYNIYEENDYLGVPSFISVDLVMQLYNLLFDKLLQSIEQKKLFTKLNTLCTELINNTNSMINQTQDKTLKDALNHNLAYLSIVKYFLSGGKYQIPKSVSNISKYEIDNCNKCVFYGKSKLLLREFDYSQMKPRGHYTKNDTLQRYFKAMMWLGTAGLEISGNDALIQSLLLTQALYTKTSKGVSLNETWDELYKVVNFFVGFSDDLTPSKLKEISDKYFGTNPKIEDFLDKTKFEKVRTDCPNPQIVGHGAFGSQGKQFRIFGQAFTLDSYFFDKLTRNNNFTKSGKEVLEMREVPNGLDVMSVLGSETAKNIMLNENKESWEGWKDYPAELEKLITENKQVTDAEWTKNLYNYWLWSLKSLIDIKDKSKLQFCMNNEGWERKSLNTALASWAELKHNTILYSKQSSGAECGGDDDDDSLWIPSPPQGYVEPNIEFYKKMLQLVKITYKGIDKKDLKNEDLMDLKSKFEEIFTFLIKVSEKELKKERLSDEENAQIQKLGAAVGSMTELIINDWDKYATYDDSPDEFMPVIADVQTSNYGALEVAVGCANEMYIIVEVDGKLKLMRGAVFSYYEFLNQDRLNDQEWQDMLKNHKEPMIPKWISPIFSKTKKSKEIKPLYEQNIDPASKFHEKLIDYNTGC